MTDEKKNTPRMQSNTTSLFNPAQIREQAERKAKAIQQPDFSSMTPEEIQQQFYELQVKQIEAELQNEQLRGRSGESEYQNEILTTVTENMLDLVSFADIEGNLKFVGKSHEIFGYELESLTAKNVMDFVHPEDLPRVLEAYKELVASGAPHRIAYRCRCRDGSYLWIETRGTFLKDENNNPQGIILSSRDITERRIAEQQLRESKEAAVQNERHYRLLFEQSPLGVFHVDENGVIVSCNDNFVKIIGSSREALVGLDMKKLPDQKLVKELRKALAGSNAFYEDTYHSVTAKKSTPIKVYFSPLIIEEGTIIGCTGIVEDITEQKRSEDALRRTQFTVDKSPLSVFWISPEGKFTYVNETAAEKLCYSREALLSMHVWDVDPHYPQKRRQEQWNLYREGKELSFESEHRRRDGTTFPVQVNSYHLVFEGQEMEIAEVEDITERKHAEALLRASEEKYRTILDSIEDGYFEVDTAGNLTFFNDSACRILGYSSAELMGMNFRELTDKNNTEKVFQAFNQVFTTGASIKTFDWALIRKDGEKCYVDTSVSLMRDTNGKVIGFRGVARDVTDRKQGEKNLSFLKRRNQALLDHSPVCHKIVGLDFNLQYMSASGFKMLKIDDKSESEVYGKPYPFYFFPEAFQNEMTENLRKVKDTGETIIIETLANDIEGNDVWLESALIPVFNDNGNIEYLTVVSADTTWRKEAERKKKRLEAQLNQAQKMESVGRLAGGVAHDFNNKLTIINGYAEMAIDMMDPSDPLRETIREIYTAGKKSADIVRQLMAFARQQTINPVQLDLNDTISGMLKMLQRLIGENIELVWHPGNNLWPVKLDPSQVDQTMANLAVNARDAIADVGKIKIETNNVEVDDDYCNLYPYFVPGQYVMLSVSDDGSGMDKETLANLFEPFFTTKEIGKGTGLGMAMIYGIVKQHNGFINVDSEPGKGTTVKIYLPRHETEESALEPAKEPTRQLPTGTETILIVEDEIPVLQMSRQILERLGYTVQTAGNPSAALQLFEAYNGTIHLLITDVIMPEMNGRDLASQMAMSRPGLKILYMSGYTADVIAHKGVIDEGVQFIQKPFSMQELAVKVRKAIGPG
ncbi:MAG: PAS domain S-box protein [Desulfobacterales bacterium]|nr:PAS domain S-box protein [Desulfobacterales bacterium]